MIELYKMLIEALEVNDKSREAIAQEMAAVRAMIWQKSSKNQVEVLSKISQICEGIEEYNPVVDYKTDELRMLLCRMNSALNDIADLTREYRHGLTNPREVENGTFNINSKNSCGNGTSTAKYGQCE